MCSGLLFLLSKKVQAEVKNISRLSGMAEDEPYGHVSALFQEWEYKLWACYDEFLSSEYKDRSFMRKILADDQYAV